MQQMRIDPDLGAIWFGSANPAALTAKLRAVLGADIAARRMLIWTERVDLETEEGHLVLFHDEDGSSHLELLSLEASARQRIVARLEAAGFAR